MNSSRQLKHPFLKSGGETGKRLRNFPWHDSPLGKPDSWPEKLKTSLGILLRSPVPAWVFWGPDMIVFYNDACLNYNWVIPAGSLGKPLLDDLVNAHLVAKFLIAAEKRDAPFIMSIPFYDNGTLTDFTYLMNPMFSGSGDREGLFCIASDAVPARMHESSGTLSSSAETEFARRELPPGKTVILLAEHDQRIRNRLTDFLSQHYIVKYAAGSIANSVKENQPQIILCGYDYDNDDPSQFLKTLAAQFGELAPPVIAVMKDGCKPADHVFDSGLSDFISLPVSKTELFHRIRTQLQKKYALAHANQKLKLMLSNVPASVAVYSGRDYIYTFTNAYHEKISGKKTEELYGRPFREVWKGTTLSKVYEIQERVFNTGVPCAMTEFPIINENKQTAYFNFVLQPLKNESGTVTDVLSFSNEVTTEVETRMELENREKQFRSILNQSQSIILIIKNDPRLTIEFANPPLLKSWSRTEEITGMPLLAAVPELQGQEIHALLRKVFTTGESHFGKEANVRIIKDGKETDVYYNFVCQPLTDENKTVTAIAVMANDITEEIAAKKQIEDRERKYHNGLMNSPFNIIILEDPSKMAVNFANKAALETWGANGEITGKSFYDVMPVKENLRVYKTIKQVFHSGETIQAVEEKVKIKLKDGSSREKFFTYVFSPVKDDSGNVRYVFITGTDVTVTVLSQQLLARSEKRYSSLVKSTASVVWIADAKGKLSEHTESWERFTGQCREQALGDGWMQTVHAHDREKLMTLWDYAIKHKTIYYGSGRIWHQKSGQYRYFEATAVPLLNENGELLEWIGMLKDVHEQKLSELLLSRSEEFNRSIMQSSPDCIQILDHEGRLRFMNKQGMSLLDIEEFPDIQNKFWWDCWCNQSKPEIQRAVQKAAAGTTAQFQAFCKTRKGNSKWWDIIVTPIKAQGSVKMQLLSVARDISDLKKFESLLKNQKFAFEQVLNGVPLPGILHTLTSAAEQQSPSDIKASILLTDEQGKKLYSGAAPSLPDEFNKAFDGIEIGPDAGSCGTAACTGRQVISHDIETDPKWEKFRELAKVHDLKSCRSIPIFSSKGKLLGTFATYYPDAKEPGIEDREAVELLSATAAVIIEWVQNTTKREAAEKALIENEKEFRDFGNNIQNLAWIANGIGKMIWYNQRWYDYTGTKPEDMLGWGWKTVMHPEDVRRVMDFVLDAFARTEPWELTFQLKGKDGSYRWFLTLAVPITNEEGKVVRWIGTNTDIEEQKLLAENLEAMVADRTHELQRSNEDLQQFAHVASHDLKEPLRKIKTYMTMLEGELKEFATPAIEEYTGKIHESVDGIRSMIDGVLSYSSLDSPDNNRGEWLDLNKIVAQACSELELIIAEKQARVLYHNLLKIEGSAILMYQLFFNLISNALKFSREGVLPVIKIESRLVASGGASQIEITVSDNGIGFTAAQSGKIFGPFIRLHSRDEYEGTGLGLSLCKKIVERHSGTITAKGEPGKGAVFTVTLPFKQTSKKLSQ